MRVRLRVTRAREATLCCSLTATLDHRAPLLAEQTCKFIHPGCSKSQTRTVNPLATRVATTTRAAPETGDRHRPTTNTVTAMNRGQCTRLGTVAGSLRNENSAEAEAATAGEGEATLLVVEDPTTATEAATAANNNNKARGHRNNARAQEAGTTSSRRQFDSLSCGTRTPLLTRTPSSSRRKERDNSTITIWPPSPRTPEPQVPQLPRTCRTPQMT